MARDTSFLWKRGNTYTAVLDVPKPLQGILKTKRFIKSLGTTDLATANLLKMPLLMEWKRRIAFAKEHGRDDFHTEALDWLKDFQTAPTLSTIVRPNLTQQDPDGDADDLDEAEFLDLLRARAAEVHKQYGPETAKKLIAVATEQSTFIEDTYRIWLGQFVGTEQTKVQHGAAIQRFLAWSGAAETVKSVSRKRAGEYVNVLLQKGELSRRTIQRHCSSLSSLWKWYKARGYTEQENPWRGHGLSSKKGKAPYRRAYDDVTILKLLQADYGERYKDTIPDLIRLALLSGARLEVFCSLKKANIEKREDGYWATIEGDKTEAGNRTVPIHSAANSIIERRLNGGGEYLFEGLDPGGPDQKRSWNVGKMFRHHRQKITTAKGEDFHAFRNTFIACMEGHEVPESTTKLLVGHKRESMTYGHYSKGERVKLREAIEKLDYGPQIMALLSGTHMCN